MDDGLGAGFWLKAVGVILLGGLAAMVVFLIFEAAWYRWGFFGAIIFFSVVLLAIAYMGDRRAEQRYEDVA